MSSLLDLGPLTEEVEIRGVKLMVQGLTASDLFKLFSEFPDMQKMLEQMGSPGAVMTSMAPELFAKVIAISTGMAGNKEAEAKAGQLGAADQMVILSAVQRLSFPEGFGPFVNQLGKLMGADLTTLSASGPGQGNSSHDVSNAALQTDSPGLTRGASPRAN